MAAYRSFTPVDDAWGGLSAFDQPSPPERRPETPRVSGFEAQPPLAARVGTTIRPAIRPATEWQWSPTVCSALLVGVLIGVLVGVLLTKHVQGQTMASVAEQLARLRIV